MQERIQQLETLVVDLMQKTAPTRSGENLIAAAEHPVTMENVVAPGSNEDIAGVDSPSSECGSMQFSQSGASYVNSAHWAAVLDGIADIKDHLEDEKEGEVLDGSELPNPDHPEWTGPQLLYGCPRLATKEEILASIPPRPVVDRLISRYFNSFEMSPAVLHTVQFLKEYEEFWENPSVTPVVWLDLLFTIMCLATQFQKFRLDAGVPTPSSLAVEQDLDKTVDAFRQKIVQCLVLGNYANGGPSPCTWAMGYHKDPKHFKEISPFTGEMRKRVWATVVELDIGISAQMGHPRLIKQWQADAKEPSNLLDADFDKDTKNMPPPRPETDLTPMLYRLVKARIMTIIGSIWDFPADTRP
ncbi:hypothetical protein AK830_g4834 [Neonectria ditissima]|uniref:Xylanolytic transcriptional activator regulatory domain-containing protein n=1 Tax=Neonectria ditissima TaxID=78410 RepID=A0A0P7B5N8_9HYPO|nr:hypothetical protein AK830_g4834 [Neonectria ditissima]